MFQRQNHKGWIIAGALGFAGLALVACIAFAAYLNFEGYLPLRPIPESPAALSTAVPISWKNLGGLAPLYEFTVTDPIRSLVWSPDSRLLAIVTERQPFALEKGSSFSTLHLWDVANGNGRVIYSEVMLPWGTTSSVAFSPDGQVLAYRTDTLIRFWDVGGKRELRTVAGNDIHGGYFSFSPDGKILASISNASASPNTASPLSTWEVATGRALPAFHNLPNAYALALSPDWRIAAASVSRLNASTLELFDATTGNELRAIAGSPDVAFSHNGKVIVSRDLDYTKRENVVPIILSDVASGRVLLRPDGNVLISSPISFSPDDTLVAGGNNIWEVSSGKRFALKTGFSRIVAVAFSPDGRFLATEIAFGTVQLWGISP